LRLPDYTTAAMWMWLIVSPTQRPPLPWEAESTPGLECGRKAYVNGKLQWHHRESNPRPIMQIAWEEKNFLVAGKQESPNNLTHLASAQPCEVKKRKILKKLQH